MTNIGIHLDSIHYTSLMDALNKTKKLGANVLQIYMGNKILTTLREKYTFTKDNISEIKTFMKDNNIKLFVHAILRLNYCRDPTSDRNKWGIDNLVYDMNMCYKLSGSGVIIHMGSHKTPKVNITYDECVINFVKSLILVLDQTKKIPIILETPVNRKNIVGGTIEGLSKIYNAIPLKYKKRVKICIDTQHIFASGYNIRTTEGVSEYFDNFNKLIKIKNIALIHLNDSKSELNSKINRHAPIGKGYIFKNNNDSITYIIHFINKHKIPVVLETMYENYNYEVKYLKSLRGAGKNIKPLIIKIFKDILSYYESLGSKGNSQTRFRIDSYRKAIISLESYNKLIYSSNDVKDLPSIGKGFREKIDIIAKNGTLPLYENISKNVKIHNTIKFQEIFGIGPEKARNIISKNIRTINDLKDAVKNNKIQLSEQQLLGLKYYKDLKQKIPRSEITEYTKIIRKLLGNDNIHVHNAGSYRSGKDKSGDIDLIISYKEGNLKEINNFVYDTLKKENIIRETLSSGSKKSIYIVKLNDTNKYKYYRKVDLACIEEESLLWYLLYFGTSREFSKKIRSIASKLGYKLNEKGLFDRKSGERINFIPKDEKDIFIFLGCQEYYKKDQNL